LKKPGAYTLEVQKGSKQKIEKVVAKDVAFEKDLQLPP
jgi:hypothetical protein